MLSDGRWIPGRMTEALNTSIIPDPCTCSRGFRAPYRQVVPLSANCAGVITVTLTLSVLTGLLWVAFDLAWRREVTGRHLVPWSPGRPPPRLNLPFSTRCVRLSAHICWITRTTRWGRVSPQPSPHVYSQVVGKWAQPGPQTWKGATSVGQDLVLQTWSSFLAIFHKVRPDLRAEDQYLGHHKSFHHTKNIYIHIYIYIYIYI